MRFGLVGIRVLVIVAAIVPCSIALAQNSVAEPAASANSTQVPQPEQGGVNWKGVGVGAGTVAGNVFYMPAKLVYGLLGGIAGGAGYALTGGNQQVSDTIWRSSLGGDYILTPDMITGKKPVHFSGPTETAPPADSTSAAEPTAPSNVASTGTPIGATGSGATSSLSSSTIPAADASAIAATHPIDSGAGPIRGPVRSPGPTFSEPLTSGVKPAGGTTLGSGSMASPKGGSSSSTSIE